MCKGVADTLDGTMVALTERTQEVEIIAKRYNELTEGVQDTPAVHVFPIESIVDFETETDRTTLKGAIKQSHYRIFCRVFARQRSHVDEDMEAVVRVWDAIEAVLEGITCDYFGVAGIKNFAWQIGPPQSFTYGSVEYVGFELEITLRVF